MDDQGFEELMEEQRERARTGTATAHGSEDHHGAVQSFAAAAPPSRFVGYEKLRTRTSLAAVEPEDGEGCWRSSRRAPSIPRAAARSPTPGWSAGRAERRRSPTSTGSATTRRSPGGGWRRARGGDARRGRGRELRPARDDAKPHRDPPAARGAARDARDPRAPGRLGRAARQAALRLHPRRGAEPEGGARRSRTASTTGSSRATRSAPSRPRARRPSGSARWRCSARSTATGSGWSRSRASRASSAAAPTSPTRPRSASSRSPRRGRAPPTCAGSRR